MEEFNEEEKQELSEYEETDEEEIYRPKYFSRSVTNSIIGGVCGGVGEYLRFEPNLLRVIFVLATLLGGWGILLYIAAVLLIPLKLDEEEFTIEEINTIQKSDTKTVLGSVMILLGIYFVLLPTGLLQLIGSLHVSPVLLFAVLMMAAGVKFLNYNSAAPIEPKQQPDDEFLRSRSDRRFMGVCGGIAEYVNVDSTIIRVLGVISLFITAGISLLIYLFISFVVPFKSEVTANEN